MSGNKHTPQKLINARDLGMDSESILAAVTSSSFSTWGYNHLTLAVTNDAWVSAGNINIQPQFSNDSGTTWFPVQSVSVAAGVGTLSDMNHRKTVTAIDAFGINMSVNYELMRFVVSDSTAAAAAGDTVNITAILGNV